MMSTVGLELTNFVNPDLTWKTVAKGSRSTRRTRRPSWNLAVVVDPALQHGKTMDEKTVSESEKLGVAVLGRRFGDVMEHVPLKKRRTMFQSPSPPPPQSPSPQIKVSEQQHSYLKSHGKQLLVVNNVYGNISAASNGKFGYFEDFSGIEMLAAAACDNSLGDDISQAEGSQSTHEVDPEASAVPSEKIEASLDKSNLVLEDVAHEDKIVDSPVQDIPLAVSDESTCDKDERTVDKSAPSRDNRLHWDLNITMDAWEQPCDFGTVSSENNVPKDGSADRSEKLLSSSTIDGEPQDSNLDNVHVPLISHGDNQVRSELEDLPLGTGGLGTEENKLGACSGSDASHGDCIPILADNAREPSTGTGISMVDSKTLSVTGTDEQKTEDFVSGGQLEKLCVLESVQVEESDITLPCMPVIERVTGVIDSTIVNEDGKNSGRYSAGEMVSVDSSQLPAPVFLEVEPVCNVKEMVLHHSLPKCEDKSESATSAVEGQHSIAVGGNGCIDNALATHITDFDSPSHVSSGPTSSSGKANKEDPSDGSCHSGVSQDEKGHVGPENSLEVQAGYDSQIEDGELREPYLQCWEENEDEDGDTEYVDYGSECEEERLSGLETEVDEKRMKVERGLTPGSDNVSSKTRNADVTDGSKVKKHANDRMDGPNVKDLSSRVVGLKASTDRNRSDFVDDCYPRAERQTRDGSALHVRGLGEYNSYHGPYRRFRPKSVIESRGYLMAPDHTISEAAGVAGLDRRIRRQYLGSSSNGLHRPFVRKRSPVNRRDMYCVQSIREISPDRPKFKRYPQGISRGIRDEYHRSVPDDSTEYPNRMAHRLTRRERSISPISGGRYYYTQHYKKSRSRSRSRSPVSCLLPRERNEGSRHRSRSPRIDRVRLPFQKRYVADCDENIMCAPRNRFSPPRNSRWFDDRNSGLDNFRVRKSPGRVFRPSQRFDSVRRLNSDDYVRPMIPARRFPDMAGGTGRGYKYESSDDDRRKFGNRYDMIQRVRRYDADGVVRRFQYNAEDSVAANDS